MNWSLNAPMLKG